MPGGAGPGTPLRRVGPLLEGDRLEGVAPRPPQRPAPVGAVRGHEVALPEVALPGPRGARLQGQRIQLLHDVLPAGAAASQGLPYGAPGKGSGPSRLCPQD